MAEPLPAVPQSGALGNGPDATKRNMLSTCRPKRTVRIIANNMSSVPEIAVAKRMVRVMRAIVAPPLR